MAPTSPFRAHLAISHCSHLLQKKCRVATNRSQWLKVQSRWFKNYILMKKCILISFWIFQYCFYYSFTHYYCAKFYSLDAGFFHCHQGVKRLESRSGPTIVGPDLGPNCLQRLSAVNTWKVTPSGQWVKYKTNCWYYCKPNVYCRRPGPCHLFN